MKTANGNAGSTLASCFTNDRYRKSCMREKFQGYLDGVPTIRYLKHSKSKNFIHILNLCKSKSSIMKLHLAHTIFFQDNNSIIIIIEPIQIPCLTNLGSTTSKTTLLMAFNALGVSQITCNLEICGYKILSIYFTIICLLYK